MLDVIVIGKGPAGISGAIYLQRAGLRVQVLGKDLGALEKSEAVENYYGFAEPIPGRVLLENGIAQAKRLGVPVISAEVTSIAWEGHFIVSTPFERYEARTVLLCTGKSRQTVNIEGFEALRGRGISFCAVCDGFFYRGKRLAVVGSGDYAAAELKELARFTSDITLFTNGAPLTTSSLPEGTDVVAEPLLAFEGEERLTALRTASARYEADGAFIAIGTASAADFAVKMGVLTENGNIVVNSDYMTNLDGLYAAGDCTGGFLQIAKAVSDGACAAASIIRRLKQQAR